MIGPYLIPATSFPYELDPDVDRAVMMGCPKHGTPRGIGWHFFLPRRTGLYLEVPLCSRHDRGIGGTVTPAEARTWRASRGTRLVRRF